VSVGAAVGVLATTFRVEEGEEARVCSATKIPAAHLRARPLVARREQNRTGEALVHLGLGHWGAGAMMIVVPRPRCAGDTNDLGGVRTED
jgi:hypothetical protein